MKTRGLFLSALMMGAVMAGCSNEEVLNDVQEDKKKGQKESSLRRSVSRKNSVDSRF